LPLTFGVHRAIEITISFVKLILAIIMGVKLVKTVS